jgi:hypothetical protein
VDFESFPSPKNQQPVCTGTTFACIFENKLNVPAYYFYWPLHRFLQNRGYWYFVKDPQVEKAEYKAWFDQRLAEFTKNHAKPIDHSEENGDKESEKSDND